MKVRLKRVYIVSFLFSLHIAISAYVNSTYLTTVMPAKYVGLLYSIASFLTLFVFFNSSKILEKLGNRRLNLVFILCNMVGLSGLIASTNPIIVGASFIIFIMTNILVFFCIDIFIEHLSDRNTTGRIRGIYLTISNVAWMLSPLIFGFLITKEGGYKSIYILAFLVMIVMSLVTLFSIRRFEDRKYERMPFSETLKFLNKNNHLRAIIIINFLVQFFFSWMVVYTPIYLTEHIGLSWDQIGIIFTVMLAPFVILSLPIGILIDKYHVKKRVLILIGTIILVISTASITFTDSKSVLLWAVILFLTRVGASAIETTSEIYFFTHVKEEESNILSLFRDMQPLSYLIGPLFGTILLGIIPFKHLFLSLGIIMLLTLYFIKKLKHHHEEYQR